MTTASSSAAPSTTMQIICDAMTDAGKLARGREPTSEDLAENMRRLNKLVNYFQTKGLKLWVQEDVSLTAPVLQAGKASYTMGRLGDISLFSKPRRVIEAYYTDANRSRRPLDIVARNIWDTYSTTTVQGTIVSIYPDKQFQVLPNTGENIVINLWMTPDAQAASGTVHMIVDGQIPNFAALTDTMYFPPEWALALEWGLASQICTGQPQDVIDRCEKFGEFFRTELEDWDVEDGSTIFQPDPRGQFYGKRFTY